VQWELILPLIREAYRSDAVPSAIQRGRNRWLHAGSTRLENCRCGF
jgi:hypothetical protein